jgi:hypothetical protein
LLALFGARGVSAAIYQSRDAKDLQTGEPLCRNLEAVKAAQTLGLDVQKACCKSRKKKRERTCRFFHGCAFQLQRERAKNADVVFAAHELMFVTLNRFGKDTFGLVIIDEGFVQKGLLHDPRQTRIKIGDLDADLDRYPVRDGLITSHDDTERLREVSQKLQAALMKMPDGRLTRQPLADEYLKGLKHSLFGYRLFSDAGKLEWMRMPDDVDLHPDTSPEERARLVEQHKYRRQIRRRAGMWKELDKFLNGEDEIAGRLILETVKEGATETRYLRVLGKKEIHETVTELPILHGDATMEIELVRHHLPSIQPLLTLDVLAPYERITQIVGLSVGKKILKLPADENDPKYAKQKARLDRLRALVIHLARGRRTLVICQMHVEDAFADIPNVETAHFGAIEGLDSYGNVEVLITIGRPMPGPASIEMTGSALTGKPVTVGERQNQQRPIRLKDGTERVLHCKGYDNDDANMLARAIAEGGVLQALGRSRAVNRTAQNPVEAFVVLDDLTLPIPVDAVVHVSDVEPNQIDEMIARGLVPEWPADAARLYPDLFKTPKVAEHKYRRDGRVRAAFVAASYGGLGDTSAAASYSEMGGTSPGSVPQNAINIYSYSTLGDTSMLCRFKPSGRGQRARRALLSPEMVPQARQQIEAVLGPLALFEIVTAEDHGRD